MKDNSFKYLINKKIFKMLIIYIIIFIMLFLSFKINILSLNIKDILVSAIYEIIISGSIAILIVSTIYVFLPLACYKRYISEDSGKFNVLRYIYIYKKQQFKR